MRRWLLTVGTWLGTTLVLLPVCGFTALVLAGPHSDLLPSLLQVPAFLVCVAVLLGVPAWLARVMWRRSQVQRTRATQSPPSTAPTTSRR